MEPLVEMHDVQKRFGRQEVLPCINLTLEPGRITGLLGPSGSGKTTLVNLITGNLRASKGRITVLGKPAPPRKARAAMGYMPQSEALYNDLTARENLRFFSALYGLSRRELASALPRVLSLVHLADEGAKLVGSFSGGMKRRLSLAIALQHRPRLLVLDEPTVGLDPRHRRELWKSFRLLANEGAGLLITTHVMDEAAGCDHLILLYDGRVLAEGPPEEIIARTGTSSLEEAFLSFEESGAKKAQGEQAQGEEAQRREASDA